MGAEKRSYYHSMDHNNFRSTISIVKPLISIIITSWNNRKEAREWMNILFRQKADFLFEIIVMQDESSDRTEDIIREDDRVIIIPIKHNEFHHSKTRMQGVRAAKGEYVVFMSGDAVPSDEYWLSSLVEPIRSDDSVAGVYSRQIPKKDCPPWEERDIRVFYNSTVKIYRRVNFHNIQERYVYKNNTLSYIKFSNVSSCCRRKLLLQYPLNEKIDSVEDQEWAKRMLEMGHAIVYEPGSVIVHSHNESLEEIRRRYYNAGKSVATFLALQPERFLIALRYLKEETVGDLYIIFQKKVSIMHKVFLTFQAICVRIAMIYEFNKGVKHIRATEML